MPTRDDMWSRLSHARHRFPRLVTFLVTARSTTAIAILAAPLVGTRSTVNDSTKKAGTRPAPTAKTSLGNIVGAFNSLRHVNTFMASKKTDGRCLSKNCGSAIILNMSFATRAN